MVINITAFLELSQGRYRFDFGLYRPISTRDVDRIVAMRRRDSNSFIPAAVCAFDAVQSNLLPIPCLKLFPSLAFGSSSTVIQPLGLAHRLYT